MQLEMAVFDVKFGYRSRHEDGDTEPPDLPRVFSNVHFKARAKKSKESLI